jgi:hypothetical protein
VYRSTNLTIINKQIFWPSVCFVCVTHKFMFKFPVTVAGLEKVKHINCCYNWLTFRPWRRRPYVPPKYQTFLTMHGVTTQKTELLRLYGEFDDVNRSSVYIAMNSNMSSE